VRVAGEAPPAVPVMDTILGWIGFEQVAIRDRIRGEGFETFADLAMMKEKTYATSLSLIAGAPLPTEGLFLDFVASDDVCVELQNVYRSALKSQTSRRLFRFHVLLCFLRFN
jgi:hypothetical protein